MTLAATDRGFVMVFDNNRYHNHNIFMLLKMNGMFIIIRLISTVACFAIIYLYVMIITVI